MTLKSLEIDIFAPGDRDQVVALWKNCNLVRPWNNPNLDIDRKLSQDPATFFVMRDPQSGLVHATAMFGYDGHRGNLYYLAVDPAYQGQGVGRRLMAHVEEMARAMGCPKIHLFVRQDNQTALKFYDGLEYARESSAILGKRLIEDH